jgi:hypothetical protein
MPIPPYLAMTPFYDKFSGIDDTSDVSAAILGLLDDAGWSDQGGGVRKSPVTPDGRYMTVELDSDDGSNLQLIVTDDLLRQAPVGRLNLSGTAVFEVWCGAGYLFIQNTTEDEWLACALLNTHPEAQDSHPNVVAVAASRTDDGTLTNGTPLIWSVYSEQAADYTVLTTESLMILEPQNIGTNTAAVGKTAIGTRREWPLLVMGNDNTEYRLRGRIPNMLLFAAAGGASPGMRIPVAFDEADTRTFAVTSVTAGRGWRLGIRED